MKKLFFLALIVVSLITSSSFAQVDKSFYRQSYESRNNGTFNTATSLLSIGIGFPNLPATGIGTNRASIGPVYLKYEHGFIRDEVGLGGQLAFSHGWYRQDFNNTTYKNNVTAVSFALLGFYHLNKIIPVKHLDVWVNTGFAITNVGYNYDSNFGGPTSNTYTNFDIVAKIGARYYVKPGFGLYVEAGSDRMSTVNLGITFRF